MRRRLYAQLATVALLPALAGGCVQMTRHSNMMIFGTNTVLGIRAGVNATSVPEVAIGYTRQEAVVLPLVANVAESGADARRLVPCNPAQGVTVTGNARFVVHPCSLVATNGSAQDSYSVLASFGANFDNSSTTAQANVNGGLAQYFATGMAAQLLSANGGAAVVATGSAAAKAAEKPIATETVRALFGNADAFATGVGNAGAVDAFLTKLTVLIEAQPNDAAVAAKILAFEQRASLDTTLRAKCQTRADCLAAIRRGDYDQAYNMNREPMEKALIGF